MPDVGVPELLIILAIVVVLFGASRVADVGGALGRAIRDFRRELREDGDEQPKSKDARHEDHPEATHRQKTEE